MTHLFHLVAATLVVRKVLLAGKVALADNSWNRIDGLSEYPSLEALV